MHNIAIPAHAMDLLRRRGRTLGLLEKLVPARTALLVVDMQNAFVATQAALNIPYAVEIVAPINRIAASLRNAGGTVCWIQTDFRDEMQNWSVWFSSRLTPSASSAMIDALTPGDPGYELFEALDIKSNDLRCIKRRFSPFSRGASDLYGQLAALGIDTVIVSGTVTNTCCESTARDAMMLNYRTIFVSDANAARTDQEHNATLANMAQTFAEVASTTEIVWDIGVPAATRAPVAS